MEMENLKTNCLKIEGLSKSFGKNKVLTDINLEIKKGACTALLGESGSGKTTLLKIVSGFEEADAGEIILDESLISSDTVFVKPEARDVGLIFQDYALFPHLSVAKNVLFGWQNGDASKLDDYLSRFGLLEFKDRKPGVLSGGQQQRVAIARAVANRPSLLLLDEPFSNLDQSLRNNVREEVKSILVQEEITSIIVTHDPEDAMKVADEIAILQNGKLIQKGTPMELYNSPSNLYVAQLMGDAFLFNGKILRPTHISLKSNENTSTVKSCVFDSGFFKISFESDGQVLRAISNEKLDIGSLIDWGLYN